MDFLAEHSEESESRIVMGEVLGGGSDFVPASGFVTLDESIKEISLNQSIPKGFARILFFGGQKPMNYPDIRSRAISQPTVFDLTVRNHIPIISRK